MTKPERISDDGLPAGGWDDRALSILANYDRTLRQWSADESVPAYLRDDLTRFLSWLGPMRELARRAAIPAERNAGVTKWTVTVPSLSDADKVTIDASAAIAELNGILNAGWPPITEAALVVAIGVITDLSLAPTAPEPAAPQEGSGEAVAYAEWLAQALHDKHFKGTVSGWKPLSGDLLGLLTQIDNMTSALTHPTPAYCKQCTSPEACKGGCQISDYKRTHPTPATSSEQAEGWISVPRDIADELLEASRKALIVTGPEIKAKNEFVWERLSVARTVFAAKLAASPSNSDGGKAR